MWRGTIAGIRWAFKWRRLAGNDGWCDFAKSEILLGEHLRDACNAGVEHSDYDLLLAYCHEFFHGTRGPVSEDLDDAENEIVNRLSLELVDGIYHRLGFRRDEEIPLPR